MTNCKSCCIIYPEKFKTSENLRLSLIDLLENLVSEKNVTNIYFYNINDCERWILNELIKIQLAYPQLIFINILDKSKFKLAKHKSPAFNNDSFLEFEEICLEHFLNHSYKNLKYCQMINKCDYAIFINFEKSNNPFIKSYRFAENNKNCEIIELK